MHTTTITEPTDRSYPFNRELFDDPRVLYHGTWSSYSEKIESAGFGGFDLPFDYSAITTILHAREQIGCRDGRTVHRDKLSMTGNFWFARCYSTNCGGEDVSIALRHARDFEAFCSDDSQRVALKAHWEQGLKECPGHTDTLRAVEFLDSKDALRASYQEVVQARLRIEGAVSGGCPVVYAIEVDPEWFGKEWDEYLWESRHLGGRAREFRCARDLVTANRIIAKVGYPNGTESDFQPSLLRNWSDAEYFRNRTG